MDTQVESILGGYFDGNIYETEEEMLKEIGRVVDDVVEDAYRWARLCRADPRETADRLDIRILEYENE